MLKNRNVSKITQDETMMPCNMCDETFNSEYELRDHQRAVHSAVVSNRLRSRGDEAETDEYETAT